MTGQSVLLNVEEELRQELEPVQTLLLQTEELTVKETALKQKNVTHRAVRVRLIKNSKDLKWGQAFLHLTHLNQTVAIDCINLSLL